MANSSSFTMAIATSRENIDPPGMGVDFYDFKKMHEPLAQTVRAAHEKNLKIGCNSGSSGRSTRINDPVTKARPQLPIEQSLALVTEGEIALDAHGHADYSVTSTEGRDRDAISQRSAESLAFRKTGDGFYAGRFARRYYPFQSIP